MCRPTCPSAPALFGSIAGSAAGAAIGVLSGWSIYGAYAGSGGVDPQGVAFLVCGTLGMGIGGGGGAAGGMVEGWSLGRGRAPAEATAARWGAGLGGLWGLQPILWLAFRTDLVDALRFGLGITLVVATLGGVAGLLGALAARKVVHSLGVAPAPAPATPGS